MNVRHGALGAGVIVVIAVVLLLLSQALSTTPPVSADDYTGHAASPTPGAATSAVAAAVAAAGEDAGEQAGRRPEGTTAGTPDSSSADTSAGAADSAGAGSTATGPSAAGAPSSGIPPVAGPGGSGDRPSWDPVGDAPDGAAQEPKVPDADEEPDPRLPPSAERRPVFTTAPDAVHAADRLAEDFPDHAVPAPQGATVQDSSVSVQGRRVLVGLQLTTRLDAGAVVEYYARHCADLGWPVTREPDADDPGVLECGFGADSISVATGAGPDGMTAVSASGAFEVRKAG